MRVLFAFKPGTFCKNCRGALDRALDHQLKLSRAWLLMVSRCLLLWALMILMKQVPTVQFLERLTLRKNKSLFEDAGLPKGIWLSPSFETTCSSAGELLDLYLDRADDCCVNLATHRIMFLGPELLRLFQPLPGANLMRQSISWTGSGTISCCRMTWSLSRHWERLRILASARYNKGSNFSFTGLQQKQVSVASMPQWHWRLFVAPRSMPCTNLQLNFWSDLYLQDSEGGFWNGLRQRGFDFTKHNFATNVPSRDNRLWRRWRFRQSLKRRTPKRCKRKTISAGCNSFAGLLFRLGCLQLLGRLAP